MPRRQRLVLIVIAVCALVLAVLVVAWPRPGFRLLCHRGGGSGLTVEVARASGSHNGTSFLLEYGDGSSSRSENRLGTLGRHTYARHGRYQVKAELHLPSNEVQTYLERCTV